MSHLVPLRRAVSRGLAICLVGTTFVEGRAQQAAVSGVPLIFDDVTVVDVERGSLLRGQRVVVVGNRIQAVGARSRTATPVAARIIDARDKYLIPGLWDMHVHPGAPEVERASQTSRWSYPRFVAHGVTGLRELSQRFENGADSFRVWQRAIAAGELVGPRGIGPSADVNANAEANQLDPSLVHQFGWLLAPGGGPGIATIGTAEDAIRVVDSLKAAGMAFIKFHDDNMMPNVYFALVRAARAAGIPLVGHTPWGSVTDAAIADSGQRSIEHLESVRCWFPRTVSNDPTVWARDTTPNGECAKSAAAFVRNGTWIDPTLVAFQNQGEIVRENLRLVMRALYRFGVTRFLAGTDFVGFDESLEPGSSLHEELRLMVDAGLPTLMALQAATTNPAKFFDAADSLGTVAAGKLADLVLLDADPLADIRNVRKIRAVVANGRYFDRAALDQLLASP